MNSKNVKLMGVAAVIIVICLLFSFLYMDNGPDERGTRRLATIAFTLRSRRIPRATAPRTS